MSGIENRPNHLPHDLIEIILLRLPVKSLCRFKAVCKQWKATISDTKFPETHLQQSKKSISSYLLRRNYYDNVFKRVELKYHQFRDAADLEHPLLGCGRKFHVLCHCNGLFLTSCFDCYYKENHGDYFLWHPSRETHKKLCYPYHHHNYMRQYGIVYDPLVEDYKVVIGDIEHYHVFYCKSNSWSTWKKNVNGIFTGIKTSEGVAFKGYIYWVIWPNAKERQVIQNPKFQIVCFDGSNDKLKNPRELGCVNVARFVDFYLISSGEGLYLFPNCYNIGVLMIDEIVFMKKVGDNDDEGAWMEIKVQLPSPFSCLGVIPVCRTHENKIVILLANRRIYLLYDDSKKSLTKIQNSLDFGFSRLMFPFVENLVLL